MRVVLLTFACMACFSVGWAEGASSVNIAYTLPTDGPLPKTYRVTLAITNPEDPDWIISTFVAGGVRTVTAENQGKFTETWDGLDENFMPMPPGKYGVKGIYMPAEKWGIDGKYHTLIPKYVVGAGDSWLPTPEKDNKLPILYSCNFGPWGDIAVGENGIASFYHKYIENGKNNFLVDLKKPISHEQVMKGHGSGGAAGGWATATDGETIWSICNNGGAEFIYRADAKPFGKGVSAHRRNVYLPEGHVPGMNAIRHGNQSFLYLPMRGKLIPDESSLKKVHQKQVQLVESKTDLINQIVVLDGENANELARVDLHRPQAVMPRKDALYALHMTPDNSYAISRISLNAGLPQGEWQKLFVLPKEITPLDCERDAAGNFYVTDLYANQLYKLNSKGKVRHKYGRAKEQKSGSYDHHIFMRPAKLAWTGDKQDSIIVVEWAGPARISEWNPGGKLVREWFMGRSTNGGFTVDPDDPTLVYVPSGDGTPTDNVPLDLQVSSAMHHGLLRYKVDYEKGTWKLDAVFPNVCGGGENNFPGGSSTPRIFKLNGKKYLCFARNQLDDFGVIIYREDNGDWIPSAALVPAKVDKSQPKHVQYKQKWENATWWSDRNGDGKMQEEEYVDNPARLPVRNRYWGFNWLPDLSFAAINQGGKDVYALSPSSFDQHGNPVFDGNGWKNILTDPVFTANASGKGDPLRGGNEMSTRYHDWDHIDGELGKGIFITNRGGPSIDANTGTELKLHYYKPGKDGYQLKWRVGRAGFGVAEPGELYSAFFPFAPLNGLVGVFDSNWGAMHVYTDEGLFVDSIFTDAKRGAIPYGGMYSMRGEFFNGERFLNNNNGKVYLAFGRNATSLFEVKGWTKDNNSVTKMTDLPKHISITAAQISPARDIALRLRGGAGKAKVARFYPKPGGAPALDGSIEGWTACEPIEFGNPKGGHVEARTQYDPDHIYLRFEVKLEHNFIPKELHPFERIFTHDRAADTVSLYFQGNPNAPASQMEGRPDDLRIVFSVMKDKAGKTKPVAVGMYPKGTDIENSTPYTYGSPVGKAEFAHVTLLENVEMGYSIHQNGKGFTLAAAIPKRVLPLKESLNEKLRTMVNFEATLGGQNKFWWSNADGKAGILMYDEPAEAHLYPGSWSQAQFLPLKNELPIFSWLVNGPWYPGIKYTGSAENKTAIQKKFDATTYPPDQDGVKPDQEYKNNRGTKIVWQVMKPNTEDHRLELTPGGSRTMYKSGTALQFAAVWIYSANEQEIQIEFPQQPQNNVSAWLNDDKLAETSRDKGVLHTVQSPQTIKLKAGWNRLLLRGYALGYDLRFGAIIKAAPEKLWGLSTSLTPPVKK